MRCPDCVRCCQELDGAGTAYEFLDFDDSLQNLKDFLKLRDGNPLFDQARADGKIGIPCLRREDGSLTLSWENML